MNPHACPNPAAPAPTPLAPPPPAAAEAAVELDAAGAASPAPPACSFPSPPDEDGMLDGASLGLLDSSSSVNSKRVVGNAFPLGNMTPS